jgi:hypothetical protein
MVSIINLAQLILQTKNNMILCKNYIYFLDTTNDPIADTCTDEPLLIVITDRYDYCRFDWNKLTLLRLRLRSTHLSFSYINIVWKSIVWHGKKMEKMWLGRLDGTGDTNWAPVKSLSRNVVDYDDEWRQVWLFSAPVDKKSIIRVTFVRG